MKKVGNKKQRRLVHKAYKLAQWADKKYREFDPLAAQSSNYIWRKLLGF